MVKTPPAAHSINCRPLWLRVRSALTDSSGDQSPPEARSLTEVRSGSRDGSPIQDLGYSWGREVSRQQHCRAIRD